MHPAPALHSPSLFQKGGSFFFFTFQIIGLLFIYLISKAPDLSIPTNTTGRDFSEANKHPDFPVTLWHHFDTTNVDFAYVESE